MCVPVVVALMFVLPGLSIVIETVRRARAWHREHGDRQRRRGEHFQCGLVSSIAIVGGVFYGLAGVNHIAHHGRNRLQNIAMVTDLYMAAVLLAFACIALSR